MATGRQRVIHRALADYLGQSESKLFPGLELKRDLGLEPLDLVLFVLDLEEAEGLGFPFETLDDVHTVSELVGVVSAWMVESEHEASHVAAE